MIISAELHDLDIVDCRVTMRVDNLVGAGRGSSANVESHTQTACIRESSADRVDVDERVAFGSPS